MLIQVSNPTSVAQLRALYRRTRAHFAAAPPPAASGAPAARPVPPARVPATPVQPPQPRFSGRATLRIVARHFGLAPAVLAGAARLQRFVVARAIVMHICVEAGGYSASDAGRLLNRDHTTVLHGLRKVAALMARDPVLAAEVALLIRQCVPDAAPAAAREGDA